MTGDDIRYMQKLIKSAMISDPVLELGTGYGGVTSKALLTQAGYNYYATDLQKSAEVDFVCDFENAEDLSVFQGTAPFGTILVLNVLEHTFNPVLILDNCLRLLAPDGKLIIITPSIWPLHDYPFDTWRINPNFYEEYARKRQMCLLDNYFEYVGKGCIKDFKDLQGNYAYPFPNNSQLHRLYSRIIHCVFRTYGRGMYSPTHLAVAAVMQKSELFPRL